MSNYSPPLLTRQQIQLRKSFHSAKSVSERLKKMKEMEKCFQESELGMECWVLAYQFHNQGGSPEKVLSFGKRALQILLANVDNHIRCFGKSAFEILMGGKCMHNHNSSFYIAYLCNLLGSTSLVLNRCNESLSYLNWANRNLTKLESFEEENSRCSGNCVLRTLHSNQRKLFEVNVAMGRKQEAVVHSLKMLEIKEKTMEEGCIGIAKGYKDVSHAYFMNREFEKSLPFGLKALEIYMKHGAGDDSVDLAQVRRNLGTIYSGLGECEKALELTQLSLNGLKRMESSSEWVGAQMVVANTLIELGRNEEGLDALKSLIPQTEGCQEIRVCSFTCMARGFFNLGKFSDARKYMKIATRVIEKKQITPVVATAFVDMASVYVNMKEYELAISNFMRALAISELPQKNLIDSSSRLFSLIPLTGNVKKRISYLEEVIEILKAKLGSEHSQVGYGYLYLGIALAYSGQIESAVKLISYAKNIFDVSLGPHHLVSLQTSQTLSQNYADMGSYDLAIEIQEKAFLGYKSLGPSEQGLLEEAVMYLEKLKEVVAESPARSSPQSVDDVEVLSETISNCAMTERESSDFGLSIDLSNTIYI